MRKEEYILKYGEEAYKKLLESKRRYREKNKERAKEYHKEYKERNREIIRERNRKYREKNKERRREYNKEYREKNRERMRERDRKYNNTGKGRLLRLASTYNYNDKEKGFNTDNNVTGSWVVRYLTGNKCVYCGDDNIEHLGLDRINNTRPHTEDNVVCSCSSCNVKRGNKYTVDEFIEIMKDKRKT